MLSKDAREPIRQDILSPNNVSALNPEAQVSVFLVPGVVMDLDVRHEGECGRQNVLFPAPLSPARKMSCGVPISGANLRLSSESRECSIHEPAATLSTVGEFLDEDAGLSRDGAVKRNALPADLRRKLGSTFGRVGLSKYLCKILHAGGGLHSLDRAARKDGFGDHAELRPEFDLSGR